LQPAVAEDAYGDRPLSEVAVVKSRLIKTLATGLLLLPLLLALGCKSELPTGAIAQVGTALVSQDQFDVMLAAYKAAGKAPDKDRQAAEYRSFEQALVEYLVVQEVLRQEASTFDVTVTDKNVQDELDQIKQMFQGDEKKFEAALESENVTLDQLSQSLRESLWLDKMKAAVNRGVTISEDEAKAYYDAHKAEYVQQESRKVRHILISPFATLVDGTVSTTASLAEWDAAKGEAERVRSEIQNGADFVSEAEKYSDDKSTKDSGGELGAVIRGQMVPAFEEAVFSLKKGDLSDPVKTEYGYHLIQVTDITPEQQLAYDQVKENIKSTLLEEKQADTWNTWLAQKEAELGGAYREGYAPTGKTKTTLKPLATTTTGEGATITGAHDATTTSSAGAGKTTTSTAE
jgi:foldase protein PrsA